MKRIYALIITAVLLIGQAAAVQAADDDDKSENNTTATAALKGEVVDMKTGEALTGVKVKVKGADVAAYTDFEGNFKVKGLKPGIYKLESSFISYKDEELNDVKLKVSEQNQVTIKMKSLE